MTISPTVAHSARASIRGLQGRQRLSARSAAVVAALLASCTFLPMGQAQMQVQQGNALDANPQVGAGGSNMPVPGYVPINGNNIITGNVTGLSYFHGRVGTFSPYEVQAPLGSSSIGGFARQSAGGLQTTPLSAGQAYYLPSATVSRAGGSLYSAPIGNGFDTGLIPSGAISATAPMTGAIRDSNLMGNGIPIRQFSASPANTDQNINANPSPLFGIRSDSADGLSPLSVKPSNPLTPTEPATANTPDDRSPQFVSKPTDTRDQEQGAGDKPRKNRPQDLATVDRVNGSNDPKHQLRVKGQSAEVRDANVLPEDETLSNQLRVSDKYRTLLDELQKAQTSAKEKAASTKNPDGTPKPGQGPAKPVPPGTTPPVAPQSQTVLDPLTGLPRKSIPGIDLPQKNSGVQSTDPTKSGYQSRQSVMARSALENTPTETLQAGQQVAPLTSLANTSGGKVTPFDELMARGESLLKAGKYLEAANAYQTALTSQPSNALAVMGRANAELGAGMYESAVTDLKFIFTRKPELISVRYTLGDYIPPQRQENLIQDLQGLAASAGPGNTASFLLCYLEYNTGRVESLRAELGRWENRSWRDSWQPILQRAWLK